MWVAGLTIIIGVADQVMPFIPPEHAGKVVAGAGIAMAILRAITNQPLKAK